jgi:predicted nucleic acid-binding protein
MANTKRIYWDACTWIAYIKQEQEVITVNGNKENRFEMCRSVLKEAEKGNIEIATSAFTLAEVCKYPEVRESGVDHLPSFFDKSYILLIPVDKFVATKAQAFQLAGLYGLKPQDAIHVASAFIAKSIQLHTFDRGILSLNQKIMGRDNAPMTICKPDEQKPIGSLLQMISEKRE